MAYEQKSESVLPGRLFLLRLGLHGGVAGGLIAVSLLIGTTGYRLTESMTWLDAFLNASMILTGMGPVSALQTASGKLFAACFALYSGLVFVATAGIILAPLLHRLLHRLHYQPENSD